MAVVPMKVGDLVKRRGKPRYAVVVGFKTDLGTLPCGVHLGPLPEGCESYPEIVWVDVLGSQPVGSRGAPPAVVPVDGSVDSCSATLLEVVGLYACSCMPGCYGYSVEQPPQEKRPC